MDATQALKVATKLYSKLVDRRPEIERFESYWRGDQPLAYASDAWRNQHARRYAGFSDNWCGVVGPAASERTQFTGIRLGDDVTQPLDDNERELMRDWGFNEMESQSAQGFLTSSIDRRSGVLVWGNDDDEPVVTWEHPDQILFDYAPGNRLRPRYIVKAWDEDDRECLSLFEGSVLWKWQRSRSQVKVVNGSTPAGLYVPSVVPPSTATWEPRQDPEDDTWPLVHDLGEPPGREFLHKAPLRGEPLSRIAGTIAMQDAVNLLWAYLFVAADHASMPARVVMGTEPPKMPILDDQGQKIGEKPIDINELAQGRLLWLTGQKASIGSWEAAKLDVFTDVINVAVKHIASQTKTPIYYINGELGNTNGETLKATETPLINDVRDDHRMYTPALRGVFRLMALVRGRKDVAEACRTATLSWANPEIRSEAQLADAALKDRQVGFPLEWIAENRYDMTQAQIARLMRMVAEDPAGSGLLSGILEPPVTATDDGPVPATA